MMSQDVEHETRVEARVTIVNTTGLHARPAADLHDLANSFKADIRMVQAELEADGKSLIEILSLGAQQGTEVLIQAEGEDAEAAVQALVALVRNGFGEQ